MVAAVLLDEFFATPIDVLGFARKQLVRKGSDMHVCQRDVDSQLKKIKKKIGKID